MKTNKLMIGEYDAYEIMCSGDFPTTLSPSEREIDNLFVMEDENDVYAFLYCLYNSTDLKDEKLDYVEKVLVKKFGKEVITRGNP